MKIIWKIVMDILKKFRRHIIYCILKSLMYQLEPENRNFWNNFPNSANKGNIVDILRLHVHNYSISIKKLINNLLIFIFLELGRFGGVRGFFVF